MSEALGQKYSPALRAEIFSHVGDLVRLAVPIMLSRIGWMAMGMVDAIMVGRFATSELAYQSIGSNLVSILFVPMMGLMLGTLVLTSNAFGAGNLAECGRVWRRSLPFAFGLGLGVGVMCLFGEQALLLTGQTPELSARAGRVIQIYGLGMPVSLIHIACSYFLEAIKRPLPAVALMAGANIINIGLNWVLVYGHFGVDPMGAEGSAWATTVVRWFLAGGLVAYILTMRDAGDFNVFGTLRARFADWQEQRRLGYAAGISFGVEHLSFSMLFIFAGWLGELPLASVTIVFNTFALFFMAGAGVASGTSVLVGNAYGREDRREMAMSGWTGLGFNFVIQLLPTFGMIVLPGLFAAIYTEDPALIALAIPIYIIGGWGLVLDTSQTVLANALRGMHDKWYPTASHTLSYVVLMIPLSWYMAFPMGRDGIGLFEAFIIASVVSVALLAGRFWYLNKRGVRFIRAG